MAGTLSLEDTYRVVAFRSMANDTKKTSPFSFRIQTAARASKRSITRGHWEMGGQIDKTQRGLHRRANQKVMRDKALAWRLASRKEVKRVIVNEVLGPGNE